MKEVKAAIWTRVRDDPAIMGPTRLDGRGPFLGRLPKDSPHSRRVAAVTFEGETTLARGAKEDQTITLHVWAFSHDLVEDVAADLDRLFHPTPGRHWIPLAVSGGGRAYVRREFAADLPDPGSELWHKVYRLRVRYAPGASA